MWGSRYLREYHVEDDSEKGRDLVADDSEKEKDEDPEMRQLFNLLDRWVEI